MQLGDQARQCANCGIRKIRRRLSVPVRFWNTRLDGSHRISRNWVGQRFDETLRYDFRETAVMLPGELVQILTPKAAPSVRDLEELANGWRPTAGERQQALAIAVALHQPKHVQDWPLATVQKGAERDELLHERGKAVRLLDMLKQQFAVLIERIRKNEFAGGFRPALLCGFPEHVIENGQVAARPFDQPATPFFVSEVRGDPRHRISMQPVSPAIDQFQGVAFTELAMIAQVQLNSINAIERCDVLTSH